MVAIDKGRDVLCVDGGAELRGEDDGRGLWAGIAVDPWPDEVDAKRENQRCQLGW